MFSALGVCPKVNWQRICMYIHFVHCRVFGAVGGQRHRVDGIPLLLLLDSKCRFRLLVGLLSLESLLINVLDGDNFKLNRCVLFGLLIIQSHRFTQTLLR